MKRADPIAWVLEAEVFPESHGAIRDAVMNAGHEAILWKDEWWGTGRWPKLTGSIVVFHGSLGNASQIREKLPWRPGAYCATAAFCCSSWYPRSRQWLLHRDWSVLSAEELVANTTAALEPLGQPDAVFVRPDSPLKPFSGRVVSRDALSLKALDYGYYYENADLPVVIARVRSVQREWRYVVVDRRVVAGSAYAADGRQALPDESTGPAWRFASAVAKQLEPPEAVYVMDVCEADGDLHLLELNPFSGADLYACDAEAVVAAVSEIAGRRSD
jgi:hypothetical protein